MLGGILMLLATIGVLLGYIAYEQYKHTQKYGAYDIAYLKKAEQDYMEQVKQQDKDGKKQERLEREFATLARADVSAFFDKNVPLNKPNMPTSYLMTWVALAASDMTTFGFNDYEARLSASSDYFTERGWASFTEALRRGRIIETIRDGQHIITAVPRSAPILISERNVDSAYQWTVGIPMTLTFRSGTKVSNTNMNVTLIIKRSSDPKHPYGIAIDKWIATSG